MSSQNQGQRGTKNRINKYNLWMPSKENNFFTGNLKQIVRCFVDCYLTFEGIAGKCHHCYAKPECLEITQKINKILKEVL